VTVCLDQMGPVAGTRYPGKHLVDPKAGETAPAGRAKQEIDYGRREKAGYVFGALQPMTGEVFTATYTRRRLVNWIDGSRSRWRSGSPKTWSESTPS
jgi:hypothetical protein